MSDSRAPISIVIPTYNRRDALLTCLRHLEEQTWPHFEVLVVDDGSTDGSAQAVEQYRIHSHLQIRCLSQENNGPARARNLGISQSQGPICLMIGDDIFCSPKLVETHLRLHQQRPELGVGALGLTCWSDSGQTLTPFMRWLDESGEQFLYHELLKGLRPDWKHFYTSNLSMKTELLRRYPFDETFKAAAMEDIELGYRIHMRHGLEIVFLPEALAHHLHPTSFQQACRRSFKAGFSAHRFHEIWPEQKLPRKSVPTRMVHRLLWRYPWLLASATAPVGLLTDFCCPNPLMRLVLGMHYRMGYLTRASERYTAG